MRAWSVAPRGLRNLATLLAVGGLAVLVGCEDEASPAGPLPGVPPVILDVDPDPLRAGEPFRIEGVNFSPDPRQVEVTVDGAPAPVRSSSPGKIEATAPTAREVACGPVRDVELSVRNLARVTTASWSLGAAERRVLDPGAVERVAEATAVPCQELPVQGERYLMAVYNSGERPGAAASFLIRGIPGGTPSSADSATSEPSFSPRGVVPPDPGRTSGGEGVMLGDLLEAMEAHRTVLRKNLEFLRNGGAAPDASPSPASPFPSPALSGPNPVEETGELRSFRIPDPGALDPCGSYQEVEARATYVGEQVVIFEGTDAPLAGEMDSTFQALGREYDQVSDPLLRENFGDPGALSDRLDSDGRVVLLFSNVVNRNLLAPRLFHWAGDLVPRSRCASSDSREILYGMVPTFLLGGFQFDTPRRWLWITRSLVVHQVKHLVSMAERLSRDAGTLEEFWLEEATAFVAEELFGRTAYGYRQFETTGYRESVYCAVRPGFPECEGLPSVMSGHFFLLAFYLQNPLQGSPLGPTFPGDPLFQGSGWSLLRWILDHSGVEESSILRDLTRATALSGAENLEARSGIPLDEALGLWSAAQITDGLEDFTPARPELEMPSWDLRDIFQGLHEDFPFVFFRAFPAQPTRFRAGAFEERVDRLPGGSVAYFEVSSDETLLGFRPPHERQILSLGGPEGGPPSQRLRVVFVRLR